MFLVSCVFRGLCVFNQIVQADRQSCRDKVVGGKIVLKNYNLGEW